ncbi:heme-binding protein [Polynucleobacter sp. IMCC30063]|uniref:GlcG/HbpS family heme-binding protein n=1 Tax=unclassified Polynucleobacter TaxID=2640945 RepID=UPI001F2523FA|nr:MULTISPECIES: heme-binding protein [unclassified Polynucleobacter]MCE7506238.1 heme-binding protein [Polynucleobacter sp. IMCC30063]MCE7530463.1 heme-binding protein [Polynucleobacter sp. IMCC 29146]
MEEKLISIYSSLDLEIADSIINAAIKIRAANGILPQAIAVLDSGGQLVAFKRENGCGIMRFDIALGKAWAALGMGMSTRQIRDRLANRPVFLNALGGAAGGRFIPVPGGVLILNQQRIAIGAVGISGDTSDKDEYCAIEAIKLSTLLAEPAEPSPDWNSSQL